MKDYSSMVGTVLGGRYMILKKIGVGGMAVVFAAYDRTNGETVAIKLLDEDATDKDQSLSDLKKQFADEARIHSLMSHPSIAGFKRACLEGSPIYFVMEYVDGITLRDYMAQRHGLTMSEILRFSDDLLAALAHIHEKGAVHCDIKPQNVMITNNKRVKLTDFGIARMAGKLPDLPKDKAVGTVYYVSPEQAEGKALDHRSDIYSLGIMMYLMASGKLPFNDKDLDRVAEMHLSAPPPRPRQIDPNIPKGLEQIILKAISKKPYMRFGSADEMRKYLDVLRRNPRAVFRLQEKPVTSHGTYHPRSVLSMLAGTAAAFILTLSVAIPLIYAGVFRGTDGKAARLSVPNLWGYTLTDAQARLDRRYYDVDVIYSYNSGQKSGVIIEQSPSPGTHFSVEPGEQYKVTVTVTADARQLRMIDVTSMTPAEAEHALTREGYSVIFESKHSDTVTAGRVCGTLPSLGEETTAGSTVTVYVSLGANAGTTIVPEFVDLSEERAAELIRSSSLRVGNVTYKPSSKPAGTILRQSTAPYQVVTVGTAIDFEVSSGSEENG